jgi:hypothetical protein
MIRVPPPAECKSLLAELNEIVEHGDRPKLPVAIFKAVQAQLETCMREKFLTQAQVTQAIDAYLANLNPPQPNRPRVP